MLCLSFCDQAGRGKMDGLRSWGQEGQYLGLSSQGVLPGSGQAPPEIRGQASSSNLIIIEGLLREAAKGCTVLTSWNLWGSHFWYKTCCQQLSEVGPSWQGLKFILQSHRAWLELSPPEPQHYTWHRSTVPAHPARPPGQLPVHFQVL